MAEKLFASLSSGLLARKGAARPAMRPQGFGQLGAAAEDLGWNDMGFEPPRPALAAVRDADHDAFGQSFPEVAPRNPVAALTPPSPVHGQQAKIAEALAAPEEPSDADSAAEALMLSRPLPPRRAPAERTAPGSKAKAAFTLRLDPERHLKLRLACAVSNRSAQLLVTDALDRLLAAMPELDTLAAQTPARQARS